MDSKTKEKLTAIIHRAFRQKPDQIDFDVLQDTKSFWSQIFRVSLTWPNDFSLQETDGCGRQTYPQRVFIKLPIIGQNVLEMEEQDAIDELQDTLKRLTKTEVMFYKMFGNCDIGLFRTPKVYLAEEIMEIGSGCFVLEDMSLTDGEVFSEEYIPGFSLDQVHKITQALAEFHHFVLTSENKHWEQVFPKTVDSDFNNFMLDNVKKFATFDPETFEKRIEKMQYTFSEKFCLQNVNEYYTTGFQPVLVHQDLNPTNILWKWNNGAKEISAIIDFQLVVTGSFCEDIGRILTLGMSAEQRRKHSKGVLGVYHKKMTELFDGRPPFTQKQVEEEYLRVFPYVCNFTLFGLSCYYSQCKEANMPSDMKHHLLSEYIHRASGVMDDVISPTAL